MRKLSRPSTLSFFPKEVKKKKKKDLVFFFISFSFLVTYIKTKISHAVLAPCVYFPSLDATTYAHFLFNAFDLDRNGSIRFEVSATQAKMSSIWANVSNYEMIPDRV